MEYVHRISVIVHEPGDPAARVESLPNEDHKAQAEDGLPEGKGRALPIEFALDLRDVAARPDSYDEDPSPEDRPADEGGFEYEPPPKADFITPKADHPLSWMVQPSPPAVSP